MLEEIWQMHQEFGDAPFGVGIYDRATPAEAFANEHFALYTSSALGR